MVDRRDIANEYGYQEPVAALLTLGDVRGEARYDYRSLGLVEEHIPELARLAADPELYWGNPESEEVWAPLHAWRALADLRAEGAIEALVGVLSLPASVEDDANDYDDWIGEELPEVFAAIGPAAFPALADYLREPTHHRWARTTAAEAIGQIVERFPELRDDAVAALTEVVEATTQRPGPTTEDDEIVNGVLIGALLKLRAVESAPVIERAFAAERVDLTFAGDWEDAQIELGLRTERQTPARNYIREKFFGGVSDEELELIMGKLDTPGLEDDSVDPGKAPSLADEPSAQGGLSPTQIRQREAEAKRKAKSKRKMAQQSRKQNRKKKR